MDAQRMDAQRLVTGAAARPFFPIIRWPSVFAGVVVGMATYLLLTLFGIAVGLTVVDPRAMDPAGIVPTATGLWTGVGLLVGAFIGGYVAARMSGLARLADGMLHGFVTWGTTTVLFAFLVATAWGTLLGGAFGALGHGLQSMSEARTVAPDESRQVMMAVELETLLTGTAAEGAITRESLAALQQALWEGDREGATRVMVEQMGFAPQRAEQLVDPAMALVSPGRVVAGPGAGAALLSASWWLFFAILLSMLVALWGGAIGVRSTGRRTSGEDVEVD